jgi:hypothetical protein
LRKILAYAKILGMNNRTPTYLLLENKLGRSLSRYVGAARKSQRSWNAIALELHKETGVAVTSETLRQWFYDQSDKTAEAGVA